jgi:hypothetical protein
LPASETKLEKIHGSVSRRPSVPSSAKLLLGKVTHSRVEEGLAVCANRPYVTAYDMASSETAEFYMPAGEPFEEMSDPDCYEEQDSYS